MFSTTIIKSSFSKWCDTISFTKTIKISGFVSSCSLKPVSIFATLITQTMFFRFFLFSYMKSILTLTKSIRST